MQLMMMLFLFATVALLHFGTGRYLLSSTPAIQPTTRYWTGLSPETKNTRSSKQGGHNLEVQNSAFHSYTTVDHSEFISLPDPGTKRKTWLARAGLLAGYIWETYLNNLEHDFPFFFKTTACKTRGLLDTLSGASVVQKALLKRCRRPPNVHAGFKNLFVIFILVQSAEAQEPGSNLSVGTWRSKIYTIFLPCFSVAWAHRVGVAITLSAALMFTFAILWMMLEITLSTQKRSVNPKGYWVVFVTWILSTVLYMLIHCYRLVEHRRQTEQYRRKPTLWGPVALYLLQTITGVLIMLLLLLGHFKEFAGHEVLTYLPACTTLSAFSSSFWSHQGPRASFEIGDTGVDIELPESEPRTPTSATHQFSTHDTDVEAGAQAQAQTDPGSNPHSSNNVSPHHA